MLLQYRQKIHQGRIGIVRHIRTHQLGRNIVCIQQGQWPSRTHDVEEVDVEKLRHMVHADLPEEAPAGSAK